MSFNIGAVSNLLCSKSFTDCCSQTRVKSRSHMVRTFVMIPNGFSRFYFCAPFMIATDASMAISNEMHGCMGGSVKTLASRLGDVSSAYVE